MRARDKADLEALRTAYRLETKVIEFGATDYPFRLRLPAERVAQIMAAEVLQIDYPNFKDTQPDDRHWIYLRVWNDLRALESR